MSREDRRASAEGGAACRVSREEAMVNKIERRENGERGIKSRKKRRKKMDG